jgi:hypothetical protein
MLRKEFKKSRKAWIIMEKILRLSALKVKTSIAGDVAQWYGSCQKRMDGWMKGRKEWSREGGKEGVKISE